MTSQEKATDLDPLPGPDESRPHHFRKTAGELASKNRSGLAMVRPGTSVFDALILMSDLDVGAVLVRDEERIVGIFSERDYARKVILKGKSSRDLLVQDIMTSELITISPDEPVDVCMALMTDQKIRHLPVMHGDELFGILSVSDVVKEIISEQRSMIEELESSIRERRRNVAALRRRESELRAILETAVDGVITIDERGTIHSFNPAAARIFGFDPQEVIGRNVSVLMSSDDGTRHDQYISDYLTTREPTIIGRGREVTGRRKSGDTFPLYVAISEQSHGDRIRFTGIVRDLTEYKRMQKKVFQAENLAAIGEMAASVAHEIKNPLAGIGGAIQVLKETMVHEDPRREVMQEILDQVDRLDKTVRQLLMLSKPWKLDKQPYDLRHLVERVVSSSKNQEEYERISFAIQGQLKAPVDPSLFEQVIWNLLHNAADAMPDGGTVSFELHKLRHSGSVTVSDEGIGVPEEVRHRLFRPFFTTKTRGTGLGLSICKKIIDAHDGTIEIQNREERGTRVIMTFPIETRP